MKNWLKVIICLIVIAICFILSYFLLAKHYEEHQYDENKIAIKRVYEPSIVLSAVIERKNGII